MKWKSHATIIQIGSKLLVNIILARMLGPRDFGLIAIAQIFIGIGTVLINTGVGPAFIQKQGLNEKHISNGFALSISIGLILMVTIWLTAPFISDYFDTPDATLIIRLISFSLLLDSIVVIPISVIRKELNYRELFIFSTGSFLLGYALMAILFSAWGFGVYALVIGVLCRSLLGVIFACRLYLKRELPRGIRFFKKETIEIFRFGAWTTFSNLVGYASRNIDYFIVGKCLDIYSLGIYTKAFQLMQVGTATLADIVSNVLFPSLSQIQDQKEKIKRTILGIVPILSIILSVIIIFLFINAENVVLSLLGEKWIDTAGPLKILCLAGYFRGIYKIADSVLLSLGKVPGQFGIHFVYFCLLLTCTILGVKWGVNGVSFAVVFSIMAVSLMLYIYVSFICSISAREWVRSMLFVFVFGILYGIVLFTVNKLVGGYGHYSIQFIVNSVFAVSGTVALLIILPFRIFGPDALWILKKLNQFLPKWPQVIMERKLRSCCGGVYENSD